MQDRAIISHTTFVDFYSDCTDSVVINNDYGKELYEKPTAEQVIGWLRTEKGISVDIFTENGKILCDVERMKDMYHIADADSRQYEAAVLKAIDGALDYLEKHKINSYEHTN